MESSRMIALTCTAQLRKQLFCPGPFSSPLAWRTGHWPFIIGISVSARKLLPPALIIVACAGRAAAWPPVVLVLRDLSGWTGGPSPLTSTTLNSGACALAPPDVDSVEDAEDTDEGNDIIMVQ
uniref:Uncharacterized protein n=1 Tax=Anopheles maculatus TaxID=74869 RepID=A0A182SN02_9DIPT